METMQKVNEKLLVERELNLLLEMTLKMEHELVVALNSREE
jgi:hypothetical protein